METDEELLSQYCSTRDPLAFSELTRRYRSLVFSAARRITGNHHDAEDVTQTCFIEMAQNADRINGPLVGWLHFRATKRAVNTLRGGSRRRASESAAALPEDSPSMEATWELVGPLIDEVIERLPEELRTPLILHYLQDFSQEEVARTLNMSRQTIARRLRLGIEKIRKQISKKHIVAAVGVLTVLLRENAIEATPSTLRISLAKIGMAGVGPRGSIGKATRSRFSAARLAHLVLPMRWGWIGWTTTLVLSGAALSWAIYAFRNQKPDIYDQVAQAYVPYLGSVLSPGFPWHSASMQRSPDTFWRGSQPLFFGWCKDHCSDWLSNADNSLLCDADPDLNGVERMPFSIDADSSNRLPMQIELLQGLITVRLSADHGYADLDESAAPKITEALCQAYRETLLQTNNSFSQDTDQPSPASKDELNRLVDGTGHFRSVGRGRHGKIVDILRPCPVTVGQITDLLAEAGSHNHKFKSFLCGDQDLSPTVKAVCQRYRVNAVSTQGQASFLILIERQSGSRELLDMKQQILCAAEMASFSARDPRTPACRVAENVVTLSQGNCPPVSWCQFGNESFTVCAHQALPGLTSPGGEVWKDGISAARSWAVAMAATHQTDPGCVQLAESITPALEEELVERSNRYIKVVESELDLFRADPRAMRDLEMQKSLLNEWTDQGAELNR